MVFRRSAPFDINLSFHELLLFLLWCFTIERSWESSPLALNIAISKAYGFWKMGSYGEKKKEPWGFKDFCNQRIGVSHRRFLGFIPFYLHTFLNFNSSDRDKQKKSQNLLMFLWSFFLFSHSATPLNRLIFKKFYSHGTGTIKRRRTWHIHVKLHFF